MRIILLLAAPFTLLSCAQKEQSWNFEYETAYPDLVDTTSDIAVADIDGDGVYYLESPDEPTGDWPVWKIGDGRAGVCLYDIDLYGDLEFITAQMQQSDEDRIAILENVDGSGLSWE